VSRSAKSSRKSDSVPFLLRLPPDLYDLVKSAADRETRSMNGEIVHALRERFCYPHDQWPSRIPSQAQPSYPPPAPFAPAPVAPPPAGP
jgi:hypothetical protein